MIQFFMKGGTLNVMASIEGNRISNPSSNPELSYFTLH